MFKYYRYQVAENLDQAELVPVLEQISHDLCDVDIYLKNQPASTVWPMAFKTRQLVVKRYNNQGFIHALKRAFRRSRAKNCFTISVWELQFLA